jgi:DNA-directed RNA polymerase specialized sigma24 family protein
VSLTEETFARAKALKPDALAALLVEGYAPAQRISQALSGHERVGRAVAELLMRRAIRFLERWRDVAAAENWFVHHAVLTTRHANLPDPEPQQDPLVVHADAGAAADPAYVAFIRALRHLPSQQREAFILHHGERLNPRMLGVAMDCSTAAAETHLQAASDSLGLVVGADDLLKMQDLLARAYAGMTTAQPDVAPAVGGFVRQLRKRLWVRRIITSLIVGLILGAVGVVGWMLRGYLLKSLSH